MATSYRIAFLGFSDFERASLAACFRLAGSRVPHYAQVQMLTDAELLVADADHGPSVQLVLATERLAETVFIGTHEPPGARAFVRRPIDALHVMRELDTLVAPVSAHLPGADAAAAAQPVADAEPLSLRQIDLPAPALTEVDLLLDEPAAPSLPERAAAVLPSPSQPARQPPPAQPARALLVDDSDIALRFLEARLAPWGLHTDRAQTSTEAQALMAQHSYDLIFVDVELGPASALDGLALCQAIKHSASAVSAAVVLVSAHHTELDRVRGALAGCDAYLSKPLVPADLARLLRRHGLKEQEQAPAG